MLTRDQGFVLSFYLYVNAQQVSNSTREGGRTFSSYFYAKVTKTTSYSRSPFFHFCNVKPKLNIIYLFLLCVFHIYLSQSTSSEKIEKQTKSSIQ
jgi:hypothetical protein